MDNKIGWIGLGNMGTPMSQQLLKAGYPVTVYNRNRNREDVLTALGATTASTPAELLHQSDLVFLMVADDNAIRDLFNGDDGLFAANTSGKLIINMSTVSPGISREFYTLCAAQGNDYLDAPVSGSVKQAQDGQLVIMAGGTPGAFERARPLFEHLGKLSMLVGDTGAGNTAKLAINTLLAIQAQGLAETVLFANHHGIKTEDLLTLISNSALGNVFGKIKGEAIINNNYQPAFALKHIAKDLGLAKAEGLGSPLGETAHQTFKNAVATLGDEDIIAIIKHLQ